MTTAAAGQQSLPDPDPLAFLEKCLQRYDRDGIRGYHLTMQKQERIGGTLHPVEILDVWFRAHPYSVFMHWLQGARKASSALYVEGENDGKMLVHPTGLAGRLVGVAAVDPDGPQARAAGRYSIKDFGLRNTTERTLTAWKAAKNNGALHVKYLGVRKVGGTGDRPCYALQGTAERPDAEGILETTVYIDEETWFQVGTVLKGRGGELIGEYLYRDIRLNPSFPPDQFRPAALAR